MGHFICCDQSSTKKVTDDNFRLTDDPINLYHCAYYNPITQRDILVFFIILIIYFRKLIMRKLDYKKQNFSIFLSGKYMLRYMLRESLNIISTLRGSVYEINLIHFE